MKRFSCLIVLLTATCGRAGVYNPMDFGSAGSLTVNAGSIAINTGMAGDPASQPTITAGGSTYYGTWDQQSAIINGETFHADLAIFCFDDLNIGSSANVSVSGSRGVVILAKNNMGIGANVNVGSAGASNYGVGPSPNGPGLGGGYGGPGQWAWSSSYGLLEAGGRSYGDITLQSVLLGGSSGGWGKVGGQPGLGGGAIELVAGNLLSIDAQIMANGADGAATFWGGGGGSGGAILVDAPTIDFGVGGKLEALGGIGLPTMCTGTTGGSGRVAMYYNQLNGFGSDDVLVYSRYSFPFSGQGTLYQETIPAPVPAPGAVLLGLLGLGTAGWRIRRRGTE